MTFPAPSIISGFISNESVSLCILWRSALRQDVSVMSYYITSALWHLMTCKVHTKTISFSSQDKCRKGRPDNVGDEPEGQPVPTLDLKTQDIAFFLSLSLPQPLPSSLFLLLLLIPPPSSSPPSSSISPLPSPNSPYNNNSELTCWRIR